MARKRSKKSGSRKPAKAKAKSPRRATRQSASSDFIVLDQAQNPPPVVRVVKTAGLSKIKSKFGVADAMYDEAPSVNPRHGSIVRLQRKGSNRDPVDDLGAKAVYRNPEGQIEFRQG